MKKIHFTIFTIISLLFFYGLVLGQDSTQTKKQIKNQNKVKTELKHGKGFVDANGDGYNDNAPDHDGDGIPNGLDEDYVKNSKKGFIDLDGDGINDNSGFGKKNKRNNRFKNTTAFGKNGKGPQQGNVTGLGNKNQNGSGNDNSSGNSTKGKKGSGNGKGGN